MKTRKDKLSYRNQLKINRYDLENELVRQAQLYSDWAIASAEATDQKEAEKNKLEIIKAEVERNIRKKPEKYSTEGAVKNAIITSKKVKRQTEKYLEACSAERILTKAEAAFRQRKSMLVSLVSLIIQIHHGDPTLPRDTKEKKYRIGKEEIRRELNKKKIKRRR